MILFVRRFGWTKELRECWNWQTGMTKDHVRLASVGSSPISRIIDYIF